MSISSLVVKCDKLTLIEFLAKFKSFVTARTDFDGAFLLEHAVLVETYIFLSLNFFTITIDAQQHAIIRQEINFKIMEIVAKHNASFAFPSQSIYVESLPK